jgi:hypothetical protein
MHIRIHQRESVVVAITTGALLASGCATTNRFVVDPDVASSVVVRSR